MGEEMVKMYHKNLIGHSKGAKSAAVQARQYRMCFCCYDVISAIHKLERNMEIVNYRSRCQDIGSDSAAVPIKSLSM
jgi:hypothetical protein